MQVMLPKDVLWMIFLTFARNFFRASSPIGPFAVLSCICRQWSAIAKDAHLLFISEALPEVAIWRIKRLESIEYETHGRMLAAAIASSKLDDCLFLELLKKASDLPSLQLLYAHLPPRTIKRRKSFYLDTTLQHLIKKHGVTFKEFYERYRPNQPADVAIRNQFTQPHRPFNLNNPNGIYQAFYQFLENHMAIIWRNAHRSKSYGAAGLLGFSGATVLPIQLLLLEEFFQSPLLSEHIIEDLTELYSVRERRLPLEWIAVLNGLVHPSGQSLLLRLLKPVLTLVFLSENIQGLQYLSRLGITITAIPDKWTRALAVDFINQWTTLSLDKKPVQLAVTEEADSLRPLGDFEALQHGWSLNKARIETNLQRIIAISSAQLRRFYQNLLFEIELEN